MNNHSYTTFQQDGASCHTSHYSRWWMQTHSIPVLEWTAQSPDLNPIEHIWDHLDRQIRKRELLPTSRKDLIDMLKEEWQKVPLDVVRNLIPVCRDELQLLLKLKDHIHVIKLIIFFRQILFYNFFSFYSYIFKYCC